jgi:RecA-family ATPase
MSKQPQQEEKRVRQLAYELEMEATQREYHAYQPFKASEKVVPIRGDSPPKPHPDSPLQTHCAADLEGKPLPIREWLVDGVIPHKNVSLLSGDGGIGKSVLILNMFAHIAARQDWLGFKTMQGPVLYLGAEDDQDEIHRRLASTKEEMGVPWGEFCDLHYLSLAGEDALLCHLDKAKNELRPTALFERLLDRVHNLDVVACAIDTSADVFGGEENIRAQVRQFVGLLRGMALKENAAVILLAHPSLTGLASGSGTSGSTAWNNSVRARLYFEADDKDKNARLLKFMKSNYGPKGEPMRLIYRNGLFVPETVAEVQSRVSNAETIFIQLLDAYNNEGRSVNASPTGNYAPTLFAKDKRTKGISKQALVDAMNALFARGAICNETFGPPSKQRVRIVRK